MRGSEAQGLEGFMNFLGSWQECPNDVEYLHESCLIRGRRSVRSSPILITFGKESKEF